MLDQITQKMTSELRGETPIDLSVKVRPDDHPLDLSIKTDRSSPTSRTPPVKKDSYIPPAHDPSSPDHTSLLSGAFKDWMTTGYSPFTSSSLPCLPSMAPWCFRLDINPTFYTAQNTKEDPRTSLNNVVAGPTLLMSGGGMLTNSSVAQTEQNPEKTYETNLHGKIKSMSRRKRKQRNSPSPVFKDGSGGLHPVHREAAIKKDDKLASGNPHVNFSVMSGGGLVSSETEIRSKAECSCNGGKYNSGLLMCPVHKIQLPKLSIPTDPKDCSWISAYVSTLGKETDS